ncbi:MAG: cytochrome P450, partial [Acidimicrobiales bacterium]|nr:cytochrome P450 [Acidimicrobiales bacterium]
MENAETNLVGVDLDDINLSLIDPFWSGPMVDRLAGFAALRKEDPIRFFAEEETEFLPAGRGYWAITRHADVVEASR